MDILIVDDTKVARYFAIRALKQLGYDSFVEADSVNSAKEILEKDNDIGLVLSDWYMPGGSGLELLKFIRVHHTKNDIPFLFQTSEPSRANVLKAFKFGIQSFMSKPLTVDCLGDKLREIATAGFIDAPAGSDEVVKEEIHMIEDNPKLGFYLSDHSILINVDEAVSSGIKMPKCIEELDSDSKFMLFSTEGVDVDYSPLIEEWREALSKSSS